MALTSHKMLDMKQKKLVESLGFRGKIYTDGQLMFLNTWKSTTYVFGYDFNLSSRF